MSRKFLILSLVIVSTTLVISCESPGPKPHKTDSTLVNKITADSQQRIPGTPGPSGTDTGRKVKEDSAARKSR